MKSPILFKEKNTLDWFIKENVGINTISNIKLILFSQIFWIGFTWFSFKINILSLFIFLLFYIFLILNATILITVFIINIIRIIINYW